MRNEKGITLTSLIITLMVMVILAGAGITVGLDSVRAAKRTAFISELETIQAKVNTIYEKRKASDEEKAYYDAIGQDASVLGTAKLYVLLGSTTANGFKYFTQNELKQIELENISEEVIINFDTREVISVKGITIDNQKYYKLEDLPYYTAHNVEYVDKNTEAPTFDVEVTKLKNSWKVELKNIVYNSNVEGGTLSYKLSTQANWILRDYPNFEVIEPGTYDIKFTDRAGNSTTVQQTIEE